MVDADGDHADRTKGLSNVLQMFLDSTSYDMLEELNDFCATFHFQQVTREDGMRSSLRE